VNHKQLDGYLGLHVVDILSR